MPRIHTIAEPGQGGLPPIPGDLFDGFGGDGSNPNDHGGSRKNSLVGLAVGIVSSVMTFLALVLALVLRRHAGNGWVALPVPTILFWNTGVLVASSVLLDIARRRLRCGKRASFNFFWNAGTLLGAAFLVGQIIAWYQLRAHGIYVATNPSHGFFYILTWTHAAHAVGGMAALMWVAVVAARYRLGPSKRTAVEVSVWFWHFLDVMWILLMLLFVYAG